MIIFGDTAQTYWQRVALMKFLGVGLNRAWRNMTYYNGIIYASAGQPSTNVEQGTVTCGKYIIATDTWIERCGNLSFSV